MFYGLTEANATVFVAAIAALGTIVTAYIAARNAFVGRQIRDQVTANGGNTDSVGDRVMRMERWVVDLSRRQSSLEEKIDSYQEETRMAITDELVHSELALRQLAQHDQELNARLEQVLNRLTGAADEIHDE